MSTMPFVAEIAIFPFDFAPRGWMKCQGQILPLSQNTALFSLLGTQYGGNGKSNFALPDLQGRVPIHQGQGPGLPIFDIGQSGGSETETLLESELPAHTHNIQVNNNLNDAGNSNNPAGHYPGRSSAAQYSTAQNASLGQTPVSAQPHNNMQPYLVLNYCIAMQGVFPPPG